jgi:hypothetical protein
VTYQIDAWLPDGSPVLFVHVRIANPNDAEVPMYWWSNIAVPETDGTRVVAPADEAYTFAYGGEMRRVPIPVWDGIDRSYPARGPQAADYFFRLPDGQRRWIAAVEPDGKGVFQTSTDLPKGRKLFIWGRSSGGRRWQEFLSEPGRGYLEIQAGLARTQAEHLPMPAHASWSWLEAYGPLNVDPAAARSAEWAASRAVVERAVEATIAREDLERRYRSFGPVADASPAASIHAGSGWGALEARRLRAQGKPAPFPSGLAFPEDTLGPEQRSWLELVETGGFAWPDGAPDDEAAVRGVVVGAVWRKLLEAAVASGRADGWLAWYHLGVMRAHDREREAAIAAFEASLRARRTPWALRNLAVLERSRGDRGRAGALLREALERRPDLRALAVECGAALIEGGRAREWLELAERLPQAIGDEGRVRLLVGRAWLECGELERVGRMLADPPEIADMREGEVSVSDLWFALHERLESRRLERELDAEERRQVRLAHPPPHAIDFRMSEG